MQKKTKNLLEIQAVLVRVVAVSLLDECGWMSNMNQAVLLVTGAAVSVVMGATGETTAGAAAIG